MYMFLCINARVSTPVKLCLTVMCATVGSSNSNTRRQKKENDGNCARTLSRQIPVTKKY